MKIFGDRGSHLVVGCSEINRLWNIRIYRLGRFNSPTFSTPSQMHTSDRLIFKLSFDSENSGKLIRHRYTYDLGLIIPKKCGSSLRGLRRQKSKIWLRYASLIFLNFQNQKRF